eukprot:m.233824 g.233824  ORF g.233824 m.233824 type:complete len:65 (-) comp19303_c0_seq4:974-1168(-)
MQCSCQPKTCPQNDTPLDHVIDRAEHTPATLEEHIRDVDVSAIHRHNLTQQPVFVGIWSHVPRR